MVSTFPILWVSTILLAALIQVLGAWFIAHYIHRKIQARQAKDQLAQKIISQYFITLIEDIVSLQKTIKNNNQKKWRERLSQFEYDERISQLIYTIDRLTHASFLFAPDDMASILYEWLEARKNSEDKEDFATVIELEELMLQLRKNFVGKTKLTTKDYREIVFPERTKIIDK